MKTADTVRKSFAFLEELPGICDPDTILDKFECFFGLIRDWNDFASLLSDTDVSDRLSEHLVDSLSLVAFVSAQWKPGTVYLDVGSGAGFPAIPIGLALPDIPLVLIERSEKKVGFLLKAVSALGHDQIEVLLGSFPQITPSKPPSVLTARAIEKPEVFLRALAKELACGCSFLCQAGDPEAFFPSPVFKSQKVVDEWSEEGLRRGDLWVVERQKP